MNSKQVNSMHSFPRLHYTTYRYGLRYTCQKGKPRAFLPCPALRYLAGAGVQACWQRCSLSLSLLSYLIRSLHKPRPKSLKPWKMSYLMIRPLRHFAAGIDEMYQPAAGSEIYHGLFLQDAAYTTSHVPTFSTIWVANVSRIDWCAPTVPCQ